MRYSSLVQDPPVLSADLSLRLRREEVAKEAGKLLQPTISWARCSPINADIVSATRFASRCRSEMIKCPSCGLARIKLASFQRNEIRNLEIRALTPDIGPSRRGKLYRKALGNATDFVARSASQFVLFLGLAAANVGEISNRSLDCRLPACPQEGGRGRARHTCAK